ncbi:MAG: MFS transporter [Dehalococcoidia bacterium]|nr:MFS transporter [Dehalococcoidia bacterium]MDP7083763.1 MFS transporter [Dehalococcoidia bacterium]MDP7202058.1 MFS transporter [Dehalococcoidia bacterium]MDP7510718.1 MFS transporter [Dehalococcoidia bacterium]HJN87852.1 MFS transporter [Dehalococcoidia bacterium]
MSSSDTSENLPGRKRGIFYGWWLVPISSLATTMTNVPFSHAMSVWAVALEREFGWSRTQLGFAMTLARVEGGILGPLEGYLSDRIGTRRTVLFGLVAGGIGFILFSQVHSLWMFYLAYVVMAIGQGFASWIPLMTMLNHWFSRRRSVAVGWSNAGGRLGALILVPAIAWAIDPDYDRLGWSLTALIIGVFVLVVAFPFTRLIRNRPQEYGLLPDGEKETPHPVVAVHGRRPTAGQTPVDGPDTDFTFTQAISTPAFWFISFGHGFATIVLPAMQVHLGLLLGDAGFPLQTTALVVATYTGVGMIFQLIGGYIGDMFPKRFGLLIFTSVQAVAILTLTSPSNHFMIYLFAVLMGIGWGGRNPLLIGIRGEYFGRESFGKILGFSTVPMNILMLASAPFAGYIRDTTGTYTMAFLILGGLNFLGGILFFMAKKPARRSPAASQPEAVSRGG